MSATVSWIGGSGDWSTATNWSTSALPGTNDDVLIGGGAAVTVTHSSGAHMVRSVQSSVSFILQGGVLAVSTTFLASNTVTLSSGTLQSATVVTTNGASLIVQYAYATISYLYGVTINGVLDVGNTYGGAELAIVGGLTLNGTALVGNPTNGSPGYVSFWGESETLGGNGTVVFGNAGPCGGVPGNTLWLNTGGTTLTIGPGITIRGQDGTVGGRACYGQFGAPQNVGVINQGTISADIPVGTIVVNAQPFINLGTIRADASRAGISSSQTSTNFGDIEVASGSGVGWVGDLVLDDGHTISSHVGGTITLKGNLLGDTRNRDRYTPQGTLEFLYGSHLLEAMSQDLGNVAKGYVNNFAYGTLSLDFNSQVTLVDQYTNSSGSLPECIYVNSLIVPSGATLNLNGLHLYSRISAIAGTIANGTVSQAPTGGGALTLNTSTGGSISSSGALDQWTFLGHAGEHVAVAVDTGSPGVVPPQLNYALVELLDPSTNLLAQASNTAPQQVVALLDVTLPADGTYTVAVRAPASQAASTGNYLVAVWDITSTVRSVVVNQQEHGLITTPYSVDHWSFSATAGQQIRFDLINISAPGMAFDLVGPNGWIGFSNLASSSGLITLPYSGAYSLTAFGTDYNIAYAFELVQTAETKLATGGTFTSSFVGSGQPQLLAITVTNSGPLLITLNNTGLDNITELYAQFGSPPTRGTFAYESINQNSPSQQILIPSAFAGTYYVLVYGNLISTPGSYSVQALAASVILTTVIPNLGPNNATITLTLNGSGFLPSTSVQLISTNGTSFPAA